MTIYPDGQCTAIHIWHGAKTDEQHWRAAAWLRYEWCGGWPRPDAMTPCDCHSCQPRADCVGCKRFATYLCPVCGYPDLSAPPQDYLICPSCGTEFGLDDYETAHDALRHRWLAAGAPWFSEDTPPPRNWNPIQQVLSAGRPCTDCAACANQEALGLEQQ